MHRDIVPLPPYVFMVWSLSSGTTSSSYFYLRMKEQCQPYAKAYAGKHTNCPCNYHSTEWFIMKDRTILSTGKGVYFIVRSVHHNQFVCGVSSQNSIYFRIYEKPTTCFGLYKRLNKSTTS
jgi:hypothetical protein